MSNLNARLRAAICEALPCMTERDWSSWPKRNHPCSDGQHHRRCSVLHRAAVLAAVAPIVEALERDRERLDWLESIACVANDVETDEPWWKIGFADSRPIEEECDLRAAIDAARATEADDGK